MKSFDDILKDKLEGLQVPFQSSHWNEMEEALDRAGISDDPKGAIDLLALQYLQNLKEDAPAGSWDAFEAKLEAAELDGDAPTGAIDLIAIQHLQNLKEDVPAGSWDAFESQLEAAELTADVEPIDAIAREHLEETSTPYNSDHWPIMRQRLDETFTIRGIIYRYKLAEISLMLLLLWTVSLYIPTGKSNIVPSETPQEEIQQSTPASPQANQDSEMLNTPTDLNIATLGSPEALNQPLESVGPVVNPVDAENEFENEQTHIADGVNSSSSDEVIKGSSIEEHELAVTPLPGISPEDITQSEQPELHSYFNALHPVAILDIRPNAGLTALGIKEAAPTARRQSRHLRVNMMAGPDYNRVFTPADPIFGTDARYVDSIGISTGVLLDFQRGKWTIGSGAIYTNKSYRSPLPEQQFGTFDLLVVESFEGISLEMLEIPVYGRYDFMQDNTKWNFYLQGGASANLILKPIYEIRQEQLTSESQGKKPSTTELKSVSEQSRLNEKEFAVGLLDGGNLLSNSYLSTSLGFGLERSISYRWSIYLQPQVQYQLPFGGFGPNSDRFHNISFRLGTRVLVW